MRKDLNNLNIDEINEVNYTEEEKTEIETKSNTLKISMEYVLSRIDRILNDTAHIHEAIKAIPEIPPAELTNGLMNYQGDHAGKAKADAISNMVMSRETTNQQLINLLEKMYDDLKPLQPPEPTEEILKLQQISEMLKNFPPEISADIIKKTAQQMFVRPGTATVMGY